MTSLAFYTRKTRWEKAPVCQPPRMDPGKPGPTRSLALPLLPEHPVLPRPCSPTSHSCAHTGEEAGGARAAQLQEDSGVATHRQPSQPEAQEFRECGFGQLRPHV